VGNKTQIRQERDDLVKRYSAWTAHCIYLGEGTYTFDEPQVPQADTRVRRCLQIAADMVLEPLDKIRVLDLACLEGMFAIEFALNGARVVGIEGREVNLAKAQFAKNTLSLNKLDLIHDDIRNLNRERFGGYDVILVLGILYHLDAPDIMEFAEKIYESCDRVVIIDTNFSREPIASYTWKANVYWGTYWEEHKSGSTDKEQLDALWASIGNQRSFVLTRASLCNLLRHVGFTSVYECLNPYEHHNPNWPLAPEGDQHVVHKDRATFVAIKGRHQRVMSSPITQSTPEIDRPENPEYSTPTTGPGRTKPTNVGVPHKLLALLPEPKKRVLRKMYHWVRALK
jgi:2-polyprenyl-3-methyl-5-hydroxy-6-metoxy-1,4-benzoquinol methylase